MGGAKEARRAPRSASDCSLLEELGRSFLYHIRMDNSSLIGTPLPQRHRSLAPSPSPGPPSSPQKGQQSKSAALFASGGRDGEFDSQILLLCRTVTAHLLLNRAVQMGSPLRN